MELNDRRLAIMRLLDPRRKFTARELAERFQVSVRTIQRDLDYLQRMGFPLYTEVGVNGGYRVLPNRILPPLQCTPQEALGLFMMLTYLEKVPDFPYGSIRAHLAEHYFSTLPPDVQDLIQRMREHITFIQPQSLQLAPWTTQVLQAAVEKREITCVYNSRGGAKKVRMYPIGIYYDRGYWYMPAKQGERVRLYRVDRMQQMEILDQTDDSMPTLTQWLSSTDERDGIEVVLHFTDFGARIAVSDVVFKSIQYNEWRGQVPPGEFPFLARKLLSYGPEVKVIAPQQLQEQIVTLLDSSVRQYQS